jgi:hypothetical protein
LAATILPSLLFLTGTISLDQSKMILLLASIGWFVHTPLWMGRTDHPPTSSDRAGASG